MYIVFEVYALCPLVFRGATMKKWEYVFRNFRLDDNTSFNVEKTLNQMGGDGWELVFFQIAKTAMAILKREVRE